MLEPRGSCSSRSRSSIALSIGFRLMLIFGIFVMWFLAFHIGLSKPIPPEQVEKAHEKYFGKQASSETSASESAAS